MDQLKLIECPRDAMQGIHEFIPTEQKITYINKLLKVGFDTIDVGSFVVIVANRRGAHDAIKFDQVTYLGYPFSISETFQKRNTNASIEESLQRVADIQAIAIKNNKELLIYVSMAFGNPYGDIWNVEIVQQYVTKLVSMGIKRFSLSDTIGVSTPESLEYLFSNLTSIFPDIYFNAHLHTTPDKWEEKVSAAYNHGCRSFDGAIKGYGGCPMAKDELTGNMPMEHMIAYFNENNIETRLNLTAFQDAMAYSGNVFL